MSTGGLSKLRLGRMHEIMAGYVERGALPGLVTLVSRRGEVHVDSIGTKAIGSDDPMQSSFDALRCVYLKPTAQARLAASRSACSPEIPKAIAGLPMSPDRARTIAPVVITGSLRPGRLPRRT